MSAKPAAAGSPPSSPDLGPYRLADYDRLPDQPRHELLLGRLVVAPSPDVRHQTVVAILWLHLRANAGSAHGRAFLAPLDVILAEHSVVQPDVFYVTTERQAIMTYGRAMGAPDLVIEVLSPGTAVRDRGEKLSLYVQAGIHEYWIVDPEKRSFEFLVNVGGQFQAAAPTAGEYRSQLLAGVHIDLARFWQEVEAERF
jgi:Uma2 family endonuclease